MPLLSLINPTKTLETLHRIIENAANELEEFQVLGDVTESQEKSVRWNYVFGAKENVVSIAVKLTNLLQKVFALALKLTDMETVLESEVGDIQNKMKLINNMGQKMA